MTTLPPAKTPCTFCPYRQDVPSGVWSEEEYAKLPPFDGPTYAQPFTLFQCHLYDRGDSRARVCAGWAGCHDGQELMGVRVALASGEISMETAEAIVDYVSPVELFATGEEAAAHGMREIRDPSPEAEEAMDRIRRTRNDTRFKDSPLDT